ncbi:MAG: hypothetical protein V4675_19985 [Verrucomicrobiota bacterium]
MIRVFQSIVACILLMAALPLLVIAIIGLRLGGVTPLFVTREHFSSGFGGSYLAFNSSTSQFGLFLRRHSIDKLPSLFGVALGKARLMNLALWCQKEQRRTDDLPQWVEVKAPSVSELSRDLALSPHNVFGDLHISLPTTWQAQTSAGLSEVPASTLTCSLLDHPSGRYLVGKHHFTVERVFLASGVSLAPDVERPDYPYLLMARLRVSDGSGMPKVNDLVCDTKEVLSPGFQGEGEHVGGSFCFDILEEFEFYGVQSFRYLKQGPDWGTRRRQKDLYYHKHSADILLLLETGSIQDNDNFHFPDKVLLQHIVDSMRANPKTSDGLLVRMRRLWT